MGLHWQDWPDGLLTRLRAGCVIPAHPLALTADRRLDPRRQRALSRYYLDAGAGGMALGGPTPPFALRHPALAETGLGIAAAAPGGPGPPLDARRHRRSEQARRPNAG